jgi:hypothetical protein
MAFLDRRGAKKAKNNGHNFNNCYLGYQRKKT